jgi:hypothetical protein
MIPPFADTEEWTQRERKARRVNGGELFYMMIQKIITYRNATEAAGGKSNPERILFHRYSDPESSPIFFFIGVDPDTTNARNRPSLLLCRYRQYWQEQASPRSIDRAGSRKTVKSLKFRKRVASHHRMAETLCGSGALCA